MPEVFDMTQHAAGRAVWGRRALVAFVVEKVSPLRLEGDAVDSCMVCGSLWLDAGELGMSSE